MEGELAEAEMTAEEEAIKTAEVVMITTAEVKVDQEISIKWKRTTLKRKIKKSSLNNKRETQRSSRRFSVRRLSSPKSSDDHHSIFKCSNQIFTNSDVPQMTHNMDRTL